MTAPDPTAGEHRRASNGPDALDTCTGCDWESWDTAPSFADHPGAGDPKNSEGVGTGAGEGATGQDTGTAWVTRSADCPEAPAQAHPLGPDGFTGLASDADYRAAFYRVLERCEELKTSVAEHQWNALERAREADLATARAESAEAAHANIEADYDRRGERLWRLAAKAGYVPSESDNDATAEMAVADVLAAHRALQAIAEDIAYQHAATIDGEFGCCHDEDALRAGGRVPEFDGDEFDPIPDDCPGKQTLDRHLARIAREAR